MKTFLLYIASFFVFSALFAQEKKIQLEWLDNQSINADGFYTEVPLAKNVGFEINSSGRFQFVLTWKSDGFYYDETELSNIIYENIDVSKLINLDKNNLTNEVEFSIEKTFARGESYENIVFTPIIKSGGVYKKVVSFNLTGSQSIAGLLNNRSSKTYKTSEITSSVLASGDWYKFKVDATGVYKITPQFLSSIGMNLNGVDASTIKIYGNGGKSLPLSNDENDFFDVPENPIKIVGAEDGVFSGDDYILFYGRGTQGYVEENKSHINPYDDNAYYYVTSGGSSSKKIEVMSEPVGVPTQVFDSYDYYTYYEKDLYNLGQLGRVWHGDKFDGFTSTRDYELGFPELKPGTPLEVKVVFSAIYGFEPELNVQVNDQSGVRASSNLSFGTLNTSSNAYKNIVSTLSVETEANSISGNALTVNLDYIRGADTSSEGYLDYVSLSAECVLKGFGNQFVFSNSETITSSGVGQFSISNATNLMAVWDVTDPYKISEKINENISTMQVGFDLGTQKTYVAIDEDDLYSPIAISNSRISNQDLKGGVLTNGSNQFQDVDYLILTNSDFLSSAQKLANFRASNDGYNVKVIDVALIYNEFSTGKQDVAAIRNFIKYVYDNGTYPEDDGSGNITEDKRLKYVCVIGDGSYDYKDRIENNTNDVPLYHAIESSSLPTSYATDDFYCFMDATEGGDPSLDKMDISIGRILARDSQEASLMVDKIVNYYSKEAYGDWRNSMLFLSDDVDQDADARIQEKIIEISDKLESEVERVNVKRILTDAYLQQTTSGGERYEKAKSDFEDAFDLGMSYINYFGHGGEDGITGENIFSTESAKNLTNQQRLPVFVTLTCELTRFDNPNRLTAGEFLYWNPVGGAVALLSTTRNLFLFTGLDLNDSLSDNLFDENNLAVSLGDAIRLAKNTLSGGNKRTVFCIGDPALKMAVPKPEVHLTEINNVQFSQWLTNGDVLKALDRVSLKGKVVDGVNGEDLSSYDGEVTISIFDKDIQRNTLVNDGVGESVSFTESGNLVYKGLASVVNGEFSSEFVLPKSVQLEEGEGKISFYVENSQALDDQSGADKVLIGGLNSNAAEDVTPPVIRLYMNDETFFPGQVLNASPNIFAKFLDENGINTAGGVGHDIIAILDGDETDPIVLNEYYSTNLDDFTSGQLTYKLNNLEAGEHTLSLRASDTYNNSSIEEITFVVNQPGDFTLSQVLNYPNPFVNYTEFRFANNAALTDVLEVSVQVMTVTGKIVTTKFATLSADDTYRGYITWDGKDDFGNKIGKGVYVYKITAKSTLTNKTTSKFQKLVVL